MPHNVPVTNHQVRRMEAMRAGKAPTAVIADALGLSLWAVKYHAPLPRPLGATKRSIQAAEVQARRAVQRLRAQRMLAVADDGLSHAFIAERFAITPGSAKTLICRLRRKRREAVSPPPNTNGLGNGGGAR